MANENETKSVKTLSKNLLTMKFMKRDAASTNGSTKSPQIKVTDEHWYRLPPFPELSNSDAKADSKNAKSFSLKPDLLFGRMSFLGFNTETEKLMELHNAAIKPDEVDRSMDADVSDNDMASQMALNSTIARKFATKRQKTATTSKFMKPSDDESSSDDSPNETPNESSSTPAHEYRPPHKLAKNSSEERGSPTPATVASDVNQLAVNYVGDSRGGGVNDIDRPTARYLAAKSARGHERFTKAPVSRDQYLAPSKKQKKSDNSNDRTTELSSTTEPVSVDECSPLEHSQLFVKGGIGERASQQRNRMQPWKRKKLEKKEKRAVHADGF